jgi:hypothetical protein
MKSRSPSHCDLYFLAAITATLAATLSKASTYLPSKRPRQQETSVKCFQHEDCLDRFEFCAWAPCRREDGSEYRCGRCRSCSMCICNTDSTDFECPRNRCPHQPNLGVQFWQGVFYNTEPMKTDPTFNCIRRFAIFGKTFSIFQIPISNAHPAASATLNVPNSTECKGYARSGVVSSSKYESKGAYTLNMIISSEGSPTLPVQLQSF